MVHEQYYSIAQSAEILGVDGETVLAWVHSNQLPAVDISKKPNSKRPTWRIADADLGRFLIARRSKVASNPTPKATKPKATKRYV